MAEIDPVWAWALLYKPTDANPCGFTESRAYLSPGLRSAVADWRELQEGIELGPMLPDRPALLQGGPWAMRSSRRRHSAGAGQSARSTTGRRHRSGGWYRMAYTPHPLREKLALFWHNHFATSNAKVLNTGYMMDQYDLIYRHALGSLRRVAASWISKDPAMMIWLDTVQSKKGMPNENYARELMELFSLGIGNFSEADILAKRASLPLTGWEIKSGKFFDNQSQHDDSTKSVLGQKGKWNGDDIVRICLEQKACPPSFIACKLFRFLVSETLEPTPDLIGPLADGFGRDFNFGKLVETMVRSNLFFSAHAYRTSIKSPVEFVVGTVHALEARVGVTSLARSLETLGQNLFNPPSVKGWDGGQSWLNGQTLLTRQNLALTICETRLKAKNGDPDSAPLPILLANRFSKHDDGEMVEFFLKLFLQGDALADARRRLSGLCCHSNKETISIRATGANNAKPSTV